MDTIKSTIQKNIRFGTSDLADLLKLYKQSKVKGGFGAFIASRILPKSELRGKGWIADQEDAGKAKREKVISFRCSQSEQTTITNYFNQSTSKSLADFFTYLIKKAKIIKVENRILPGAQLTAINKFGHNVNQLARKANSLKAGEYNDTILSEIHQELVIIREQLNKITDHDS